MTEMLTAKEIAGLIKMNEKHVADRITHRADFPKPRRIGRVRRWTREEVIAWIESRKEV